LKDFRRRATTGLVYVLLMLVGAAVHPLLFAVVFGGFLFFTQLEFYQLVETTGSKPRKNAGLALGVLFFLVFFGMVNGVLPSKTYLIFIPALIFIFLFETFSDKSLILQNSAVTLTGFVYVAIPFSLLNFIVHPGYPYSTTYIPDVLLGVLFTVWIYDSFAYLVGSKFGKHKMLPRISPKKSWEGFAGGMVAALIMGALNSLLFTYVTIADWLVMSVIVVIFSTLGDMFESIIKRRLKVKDSGTILPGHGGLLDRFDSLLFVIPVIYVWLTFSGNI
jgi:phosphatidate cytidylyltransferase